MNCGTRYDEDGKILNSRGEVPAVMTITWREYQNRKTYKSKQEWKERQKETPGQRAVRLYREKREEMGLDP